tara:strand:+ start:239 stop:964 length:726 start_codon:yes stop_codon:yes gene_type:complete
MSFLLLFALGLICWFFSTVAAGGAATILIPFIAFALGVQMVAPIITIAALIANPTRVYAFRKNINWQIVSYLLPGSIIGAILGAWSFSKANTQIIQIILGLFLISYVLENTLRKSNYRIKMKLIWFFPLGIIVSFLSGLIGATGPIQNPFMLNYGITKEYLIGTKSINSMFMQITKLMTYSYFGFFTIEVISYGFAIGCGAIIGIFLARNHLKKINTMQFKQYTITIMFFCGIVMLYKALQ